MNRFDNNSLSIVTTNTELQSVADVVYYLTENPNVRSFGISQREITKPDRKVYLGADPYTGKFGLNIDFGKTVTREYTFFVNKY